MSYEQLTANHPTHFANGTWPSRGCETCRRLTRPARPNPDAGREPPWSYNPEENLRDAS